MKRLFYIVYLLLIVACNSGSSNSESLIHIEDVVAAEKVVSPFGMLDVIESKLQDVYDLSVLLQKHPEFEADLKGQLQDLSNFTPEIDNDLNDIGISDIEQIGNAELVSDNVTKLRLKYRILSSAKTRIDTVFVLITETKIPSDEGPITSTKIKFYKE